MTSEFLESVKLNRHEHCLNGLFFFFQSMFSQQQAQMVSFSQNHVLKNACKILLFQSGKRARIMCPLKE